jgi:class 3 adenylate cyclase
LGKEHSRIELTKQHFSTKIFSGLLVHLTKKYPELDLAGLVRQAGLELEYLQNKFNWVSVSFLRNFVEALKIKTGTIDDWFEAGETSVSEPVLGTGLHFMASKIFSVQGVYQRLFKFHSLFNRVTAVDILEDKPGNVTLKMYPVTVGLSEEEINDLLEVFEVVFISTKGYYRAIPTLQGYLHANIETNVTKLRNNLPCYQFQIQFETDSSWNKILNSFGITLGTFIFGVGASRMFNFGWLVSILSASFLVVLFKSIQNARGLANLKKQYSRALEDLRSYDIRYLREHRAKEAAEKFVPWEFIKLLGHEDLDQISIGDSLTREMTVMFFDLRGFSSLSEKLSSEEAVIFLNGLLARMVPIVQKKGGLIDKYEGDGFMAIFPDRPENAVLASIDMFEEIEKINQQRLHENQISIRAGIGLASGQMTLGAVGNDKQIRITTMADTVNIAARLEKLNKSFGTSVLMNDAVAQQLSSKIKTRRLGSQILSGKNKKTGVVQLYEVEIEPFRTQISRTRLDFERAIDLLEKNHLLEAHKLLQSISEQNPFDRPCLVFLEKAAARIDESKNPSIAAKKHKV